MSMISQPQQRKANGRAPSVQQDGELMVRPSPYFRWNGHVGRAVAALLLIPGLPVMGLLILLVRMTSRGPGVYRQIRVGRHGKTFIMYKIRTMRQDAEALTGATWTQDNDPRVIRLGRVLRKLHLDEFPQLLNVVRGEMNLIGPRPERPEFTQVLAREIPGYLNRLAVCPGITGLAQINLPPDTGLDSVRRKLALDLEYIHQAGPLLDLRMFLCTFMRLLGLRGYSAMRLMRLERHVQLPDEVDHARFVDDDRGATAQNDSAHNGNGNGNGNGKHKSNGSNGASGVSTAGGNGSNGQATRKDNAATDEDRLATR